MNFYTFKNVGAPLSNINGNYVNIDNSHSSGGFSSNETSLQFGLPNYTRSNVAAISASKLVGGGRSNKSNTLRRKIKKIASKYKTNRATRNNIKKSLINKYTKYTKCKTLNNKKIHSHKRLICHKHHKHTKKCYCTTCLNKNRVCYTHCGSKKTRKTHKISQKGGDVHAYSVGGILTPHDLKMANPPPIQILPTNTKCDNIYTSSTK